MKSPATKIVFSTVAAIVLTLAAPVAHAQTDAERQAQQTETRLLQDALARGNRAENQGQSVEKVPSPKRIENSLPLTSHATRQKNAQILQ